MFLGVVRLNHIFLLTSVSVSIAERAMMLLKKNVPRINYQGVVVFVVVVFCHRIQFLKFDLYF